MNPFILIVICTELVAIAFVSFMLAIPKPQTTSSQNTVYIPPKSSTYACIDKIVAIKYDHQVVNTDVALYDTELGEYCKVGIQYYSIDDECLREYIRSMDTCDPYEGLSSERYKGVSLD